MTKTRRFQSAHDMRVALLNYLEHEPFSQEDLEKFMLQHFQTARLDLQRRIQATIFPADVADPVISVTETETDDWDPILLRRVGRSPAGAG